MRTRVEAIIRLVLDVDDPSPLIERDRSARAAGERKCLPGRRVGYRRGRRRVLGRGIGPARNAAGVDLKRQVRRQTMIEGSWDRCSRLPARCSPPAKSTDPDWRMFAAKERDQTRYLAGDRILGRRLRSRIRRREEQDLACVPSGIDSMSRPGRC